MKMNKKEILDFYIAEVENNFYPYWNTFADDEKGGILNCINNFGNELLSENKFTWSQGRYLWILGRIYTLCEQNIFKKIDIKQLKKRMDATYHFLIERSINKDSICNYLLTRDGEKIIEERTQRYDASIFADCFALIGMAQYAKTLQDESCILEVTNLYNSIIKRLEQNNYLTEPYPVPSGYTIHSIPMIMVNTVYEFIKMKEVFGLDCKNEVNYGLLQTHIILEKHFFDGYIREFISTQENYQTKMLDRHINPGHTIEDVWFLYEFLNEYGNISAYSQRLCTIAKNAYTIGWDKEHGGLLRFVDKDGGQPHGETNNDAFEVLIKETWDMKLWWPHSECLYTFLLLNEKIGDTECIKIYESVHDYIFKTFPNKDLGEWIQIRKRDGSPQEKLVALPVKDPFHILRNYLKIIELYSEERKK